MLCLYLCLCLVTALTAVTLPAPQVVNLFANDAQRIFDLCVFGPLIIGGPVIALGGCIYIGLLLGPYALFGMVAFVLFYPLQVSRSVSRPVRQPTGQLGSQPAS